MRVDQITGIINPTKTITTFTSPESVTIHDVHVLDSSGSMDGGKYTSALEGINADIQASKEIAKSTKGLTSTMTIIEFDSRSKTHHFMQSINDVGKFSSRNMGGMTALYDTIGEAIERLLSKKKPQDKVLMKIFTDGGENDSKGKYAPDRQGGPSPKLAELMSRVQKDNNFTITFVGTQNDTTKMVSLLNIDASNTLVHNNTPQSVKMSFDKTVLARTAYVAKSMAGEDVSRGFYTKSVL